MRYQRAIRNHILPELGGVRLASLTPARVQKLYKDLAKQGLSASTIELHHNILHRASDKAVMWRLIPHNPCDAVDAPRASVEEMQTWNPDQARIFLVGTTGDQWAALWRLAVMVGLRRGELLALRWADLDLDRGMLAVRRTITRGKDGLTYNEPKSKAGRRSIALPGSCVKALRHHRAKQAERRLMCGNAWQDNDLVFDTGIGAGISFSVIHRAFKRLSTSLGLPDIRLHDLRHTAATLALSQGIHPKVVQEMLGHSDISMTLNRYSHVSMTMQREAADRLDAALGA